MHQFFKDIQALALDTVFPLQCLFCNVQGEIMCATCVSGFKKIEHQICIVCNKLSLGGLTHPACNTPYAPDGLLSLFNYHDDKISNAIIYGKYKFIPSIYTVLGKTLAQWTSQEKLADFYKNFIITPLPLASSRKRWRGFNQAELLGHELSKTLRIPVASMLTRIRATKTQKDLDKNSRQRNIEGAFTLAAKLSPPWYHRFIQIDTKPLPDIKNQNIMVVDDVITTGSTLKEAVKVLKRNGAGKVWCITLARD